MIPPFFYAFITYFVWGVGDVIGASASRKIGGYSNTFWLLVIRTIFLGCFIPFFLTDLSHYTLPLFALNIVLGLLLVIGILGFTKGLEIGNVSLVGTIANSAPIITVPLSIIFLGERVNFNQLIAISLILTGVIISSFDFQQTKKGNFFSDKGVKWALLAMICWGIFFAFIKILVNKVGWFWPSYISFTLFPPLYLYYKIKGIRINHPNYNNAALPLFTAVLFTSMGDFAYNFALSHSQAAIVAPIAGAAPTLFAPLAYFFYRDPITKQQILGIVITLIGIVALSFFSI